MNLFNTLIYTVLEQQENGFLKWAQSFLHNFAEIIVLILELMGIVVIVAGAVKAIIHYVMNISLHKRYNMKIDLANSLSLGLEFKMGAEIINTVLIRELNELLILGIIIVLRALLAFLIHWEIRSEKKLEAESLTSAAKIEVKEPEVKTEEVK